MVGGIEGNSKAKQSQYWDLAINHGRLDITMDLQEGGFLWVKFSVRSLKGIWCFESIYLWIELACDNLL